MMKGRQDIVSELQQISQMVAGLPGTPVFTVPEGYFDRFPDLMLQKAKEVEGTQVSATEEIATLSPLLAGLNKAMPMKAPEGYFSVENIVPPLGKEKARLMPMAKKSFRMYAVAASLVAILGFAMLLFNMSGDDRTAPGSLNVASELPKLSEKEMDDFLAAFPDLGNGTEPITAAAGSVEAEEMIRDIDEKGLEEFLSEMPDVRTEKFN